MRQPASMQSLHAFTSAAPPAPLACSQLCPASTHLITAAPFRKNAVCHGCGQRLLGKCWQLRCRQQMAAGAMQFEVPAQAEIFLGDAVHLLHRVCQRPGAHHPLASIHLQEPLSHQVRCYCRSRVGCEANRLCPCPQGAAQVLSCIPWGQGGAMWFVIVHPCWLLASGGCPPLAAHHFTALPPLPPTAVVAPITQVAQAPRWQCHPGTIPWQTLDAPGLPSPLSQQPTSPQQSSPLAAPAAAGRWWTAPPVCEPA